jgi:aarF domain-containing kinase
VKVQHEGLREASAADLATIDFLVKALHWLLPDFNYQWLVDEAKDNLPKARCRPSCA